MFLSMLALNAERINVDLRADENKSESFMKINPAGQVPTLIDADVVVADSATILVYLAVKYGGPQWFPRDPVQIGEVYKWFTVVGDGVDQGTFAARMVRMFGASYDYAASVARGESLLRRLDAHLAHHDWLVGTHVTVADIHMYPYVRLAEDGGISLAPYLRLDAWFKRVEAVPGYLAMHE